jgi:hypothetical protein
MPRGVIRFVPALLVACAATICSGGQQTSTADDCLSRPNGPSPPGTHWYYHLDRATQRQCWYLGQLGARTQSSAREVQAPARPRARKAIAQPTSPSTDVPISAQPAPAEIAGKSTVTNQDAGTQSNAAAADVVTVLPTLPTSAASSGDAPASATTGYSEEPPATETDPQDEMPLIWPVLTPQELAAFEPSPGVAPIAQLAAALGAVLGITALIFRFIFRPTAKVPHGPRLGARWGLDNRRNMTRRARKAARDQAAESELQGLLRELQRRSHASEGFHLRSRRAAA